MRPSAIAAILGSGPAFTARTFDLTSSVPAEIAVTAPARSVIVSGALTSVSAGTPALESWGGVSRGLSLHPAATNQVTASSVLSGGAYVTTGNGVTVVSGGGALGPDGVTASSRITETATTGGHTLVHRDFTSAMQFNAGERVCIAVFAKPVSGSIRDFALIQGNNNTTNNGGFIWARIDGTPFAWAPASAFLSDIKAGVDPLASGIVRVWMTGTWVSSTPVLRELRLGPAMPQGRRGSATGQASATTGSYTGAVTEAIDLIGVQVTRTTQPGAYIATAGATASVAASTAAFSSTSWLDPTQGTLIVHHDALEGVLLGSGSTAILSSGGAVGKSAIAWDASGASICHNGLPITSVAAPTFTPADLRLLATSAAQNTGHISRIEYQPTRLSDEALRQATRRAVTAAYTPGGTLRYASTRNRLPVQLGTLSGTNLSHFSYFPAQLANYAHDDLYVVLPNICIPHCTVGTTVGAMASDAGPCPNDVVIDSVRLERRDGVNQFVDVRFGGSLTATLTAGTVYLMSDRILPTQFTGWTQFPAGAKFRVRFKGRVASTGQRICGTWDKAARTEDSYTPWAIYYDPAVSVLTDTGLGEPSISNGASVTQATLGYVPLLIGTPAAAAGNPVVPISIGDSITQGLGSQSSHVALAPGLAGMAGMTICRASGHHTSIMIDTTGWPQFLQWGNVVMDWYGTNQASATWQDQSDMYAVIRAQGIAQIHKGGLWPQATSTDGYATAVNQTVGAGVPDRPAWVSKEQLYAMGVIDGWYEPLTMCDDPTPGSSGRWKWKAGAGYQSDSVHPSQAGHTAEAPFTAAYLQSIRL